MTERLRQLEEQLQELDASVDPKQRVDVLLDAAEELFSGDDPQRLIQVTNEALDLAKRMNYTEGEAYGLWFEGLSCCFIADHERGLKRVDDACKKMEDIGDEFGVAKSWYLKGNLLRSIGSHGHALELMMQSLEFFVDRGHVFWAGDNYYGLGLLYEEIGNWELALENHKKCIEITRDLPKGWLQGRALNGVGRTLGAMERHEEALDHLHQALKLFQEIDHTMGEARVLDDIGSVYYQMGDHKLALSFHSKGLELRESIGQLRAQCSSLLNIARVQLKLERAADAISVLANALAIAKETQSKQHIYDAHNLSAQAYEMDGQVAKALDHYKKYQQVREEVFNEEANDQIRKLQIAYSVQKAEKETTIAHVKNVELKEQNEKLEALLKELHDTQTQLVQSERMAAIGKIVAGIMHEMNSPLGASNSAIDVTERCMTRIENNSEIDRDQLIELMTQVKNSLQVSRTANGRLTGILDNLRSFIRLDGGERAKIDVHEGIDSTLALLEADTRGRIVVNKEYGELPEVFCYPGEMNQVFMSLLSNAVEAIPKEGTITVRTSANNGNVVVAVSDTGQGMDEEKVSRLFEPGFNRGGGRVKAGLGLLVTLNIVQKHGGTIDVQSKPGEGSTFTLNLPCT